MQTRFTLAQLADPDLRDANDILRACVHCGFCLPACPTYTLLGDELDSPRGRIYQIKTMLEEEARPGPVLVRHLDRCLGCLSCMTACPSGVDYRHLSDIARTRIWRDGARGRLDKGLRRLLAAVLSRPTAFRVLLAAAALVRPAAGILPARLRRLIRMLPPSPPAPSALDRPALHRAAGESRGRVLLPPGCAQRVLRPQITESAARLLNRAGWDAVIAPGGGCCGALHQHMGDAPAARTRAMANIRAWLAPGHDGTRADAIVSTASGCGAVIKDYGHMVGRAGNTENGAEAENARQADLAASLTTDITVFLKEKGLPPAVRETGLRVAWHAPCSLRNAGDNGAAAQAGPALLRQAGFQLVAVDSPPNCCGSAGTYNILQPELADELQTRMAASLTAGRPDVIASANIGCIIQIGGAAGIPVLHVAELLDYATGGPKPEGLA